MDPLIVRGILVVAALFGLPALFLYALAWAVLPDVDGRMHLRDLLQRRYDPVQLGILAVAVIGLFPTAPLTGRLFGLGYDGWSALSTVTWVVGLVLAAALLFLIVRAARRTPGASAPDLPGASADPAAPAASAPSRVRVPPRGRTPFHRRLRRLRRLPSRRSPETSPSTCSPSPPRPRRCLRAPRTRPRWKPGAHSMPRGRSRIRPGAASSRTRSAPRATSSVGSVRPKPPRSPLRPRNADASAARRTRVPASRSSWPRSDSRSWWAPPWGSSSVRPSAGRWGCSREPSSSPWR
ncbi:PspC domain-containing protein [Microbacterium sp. 1S1]|uniref:PspC domain-containing protein n=1 Tax=Microbacterium sp. 1S1 TaxID=2606451 RepID=UPI0039761BCC